MLLCYTYFERGGTMIVNKETADKIWLKFFGNTPEATDAFGYRIRRSMHGGGINGSWEVDHIWPQNSAGAFDGSNTYSNVQPLAAAANREKANNTKGSVCNKRFSVIDAGSDHNGNKIGKMQVLIDGTWYWGYNYDINW